MLLLMGGGKTLADAVHRLAQLQSGPAEQEAHVGRLGAFVAWLLKESLVHANARYAPHEGFATRRRRSSVTRRVRDPFASHGHDGAVAPLPE